MKETFVNVAKSKEQVLPEVDAKSEGVTARIVPSANRPSTAKDLTARSNSDLTLSTPTTVRPKDQNTLNNSHAKILGDTPKSAASENTKTTATEPVRDRTSAFTTPVTPEKVVATKDGKAPATHQARPWTPTSHRNIVDEVVEHYTNRATTPESDGTYIADSQLEPNERPVTKPEIGASSVRASDRKEVPARQSQAKSVNQKLSQPEKQNSQTGEVVLEHLAEVKTETKQSVQASRVETQKPVLEETRVSSDNQIATTAPIDRKGNSQPKVTNDTREARSFARAGQPPVKLPAQPLVEPAPLVHATEKKGDVVRIVTNEQNESSEMMSPKEVLGYKFVPKDSRAPQQTSANAGNAVVSNEVESDTKIDALRYNRATQNSQSRVAHTVLLDSKDRDGAKHNQEVIAPTTKTSELPAVSVPKMPIANDAPELLSEPEVARGIETTHESSEYGIGKAAPQYKVVSTHVQKPIEAIRVPETAAAKLAAKSEVHSPPASESKQSVNNAASEPVVNSKSSANSALHSISSLKPVKTATPKENHTSLEHMFAGSEEATEILLNDKSDVSAKVSPTAREVRNTSPTSMLNKAPLSGPTTKYAEPVISATANSSETKQAPLPVTSRAAKAMETIVPKNTDIRENAETPRMDMQKVSVDSQKGENRNNVSFAPLPKNVNTVSKSENIVTETKPADLPKQNTAPLESTSPEARNVTKNTLNNLRAPAPALVRDAVQIATPNVSPDSRTIVPLFAQPQPFAQSVRNDSSSSAKPEPKAERPVQAVNANEAERSPQSTNQNGGDASSQNTERDHSQAGFKPIVESSPQNIQHTSSARTQSMQQHALNESLKAALQQALDMSRKRLVEPNELRLSVPLGELGTMDIDVVRETEKISIRIGADHKALALLEDQKPYLTQWLRDQGYPVEQLDLSPRSNGNPNSGLTGSNTSSQDSQTSRSMRSESSLTGQTIEMADSFQPAARPTNSGQHVWTA
ncbi:MAG: hypothetical protein KDB65_03980 [Calditrichaeota bacterium]|nr:hypothetical protein [Calditrichota bacterium]